jgi:hypothetical protein
VCNVGLILLTQEESRWEEVKWSEVKWYQW